MIFEQRPELWSEAHTYLGRPFQAGRMLIESLVCLGNSKEATMAEAEMMKGERGRRWYQRSKGSNKEGGGGRSGQEKCLADIFRSLSGIEQQSHKI